MHVMFGLISHIASSMLCDLVMLAVGRSLAAPSQECEQTNEEPTTMPGFRADPCYLLIFDCLSVHCKCTRSVLVPDLILFPFNFGPLP